MYDIMYDFHSCDKNAKLALLLIVPFTVILLLTDFLCRYITFIFILLFLSNNKNLLTIANIITIIVVLSILYLLKLFLSVLFYFCTIFHGTNK